ncbi:Transglutaminase-like superfamily protein [Roseivivax jejudonensis]|uniref:Transglutaminase-like superfamily protein n=1 Tax=Roseivivax jejudonensis TaxID=1529041 RepID=A0A1X6YRY1_9RHOB|nr:transglutaminase family protein [Roseivivax jejudonensis]SLN27621.1 Transglutaminase-like superfamily protein [Roseivivax jejudonensis]
MTLVIDIALDYALSAPTDCLLQLRAAQMPDQSVPVETLDFGSLETWEGPAQDGVGTRIWCRPEGTLVCRYHAEVEIARKTPDIAGLPASAPADLPSEVVKYLFPSRYCPSDKFLSFVAQEFGAFSGGAKVAAMRDFVASNLTYVPGASTPETSALETFVTRQGVCRDFAHMLITLLRAGTIPARFVSAYGLNVTPPDFHAVVEVWLDGAWHLIDPSGMTVPWDLARISVGRDATDVAFLTTYGPAVLQHQSVRVNAR